MRLTSESAERWLQEKHKGSQWVGFTMVRRYAGTDKPQRKRTTDKMVLRCRTDKDTPNPYEFGVATISSRALKLGSDYGTQVENATAKALATATGGVTLEVESYDVQPLWKGKGQHDTRLTVKHIETGNRSYKGKPADDPKKQGPTDPVERRWYVMQADDTLGREIDGAELDALPDFLPKQSNDYGKQRAYAADQLVANGMADRAADVQAEAMPVVPWRTVRLDNVLELRHGGRVITVTDTMRATWGKALTFHPSRDGTLVVA